MSKKLKIFLLSLLLINTEQIFSKNKISKSFDQILNQNFEQNFSLNTTNTWFEFAQQNHQNNLQNNLIDSAWIGLLTFKSKNTIKLDQLALKWSGNYINSNKISASLYKKKEKDNILIPVEENLICDGKWDKNKQRITFNNMQEKLISVKKYYLLVSFPQNLKQQIRSGNFLITKNDSLRFAKQ
ncbi:hypothetical protein K9L05_03280 [Candidatus Babeliales bacterium]|nr:hypothetical protein [Candidatus Babeliales bacterium]MCF7899643.1 hypothetical protein [Candidatus Babeliales bacterium]